MRVIGACICGIIAVLCFMFSGLQFLQKGYLFNNAYIYASQQERETMDKTPHYRQSGVVFALAGGIFTVNAIDCIAQTDWLFLVSIALVIVALTYAVASSVIIEKRKK